MNPFFLFSVANLVLSPLTVAAFVYGPKFADPCCSPWRQFTGWAMMMAAMLLILSPVLGSPILRHALFP